MPDAVASSLSRKEGMGSRGNEWGGGMLGHILPPPPRLLSHMEQWASLPVEQLSFARQVEAEAGSCLERSLLSWRGEGGHEGGKGVFQGCVPTLSAGLGCL